MNSELPPITAQGLAACALWLLATVSGRHADPGLLTRGLPQGRITDARIADEGSIAVIVADHRRQGGQRTERHFDTAGLFITRMLLAPSTRIRIDENDKKSDLHYVVLHEDTTLLRLIADAQPGQKAKQIRTARKGLRSHYDVRRTNVTLTAVKPGPKDKESHQGRALAVADTLAAYDKLPADHWLPQVLSKEDLVWMLETGFELLDRHPLGPPKEG